MALVKDKLEGLKERRKLEKAHQSLGLRVNAKNKKMMISSEMLEKLQQKASFLVLFAERCGQ